MRQGRIHRKELQKKLKEDEVAVFFSDMRDSISEYMEKYGRLTFWAVIVVVLIVGLVTLFRWKQRDNFIRAQETYTAATAQIGGDDYIAAQSTLSELIDQFGGGEMSTAAYALRGYANHHQRDYTAALNDYQTALSQTNDKPTQHALRIAIAQCYRSMGQPEEAVREIEDVLSAVESQSFKDQATFLLAQCKEDLNQPEQALALYKQISEDSTYRMMARQRIVWLESKPASAINQVG